MKKLIFAALAAVFMLSSGFDKSQEISIETIDDFGCSCTISYYSWNYNGDYWSYGPVSASAMVSNVQACDQWANETLSTSSVYDASNCQSFNELISGPN